MFTFNYSHSSNNKHHFNVSVNTIKHQRSDATYEYEDIESNIVSYDMDTEDYQLRDDSFPEALEETLCMQFEEYIDYWLKTA